MKRLLLLLIASTALAQSPQWIKVSGESSTSSISLVAGTTYRWGTGTCWAPSVTVAKATTIVPYYTSLGDPCPGVVKELDVQEAGTAQTIVVTDNGVKPPKVTSVSVPANAPPPPAPPPVIPPTVTATYTCTVTLYSDGTFTADSCVKQ